MRQLEKHAGDKHPLCAFLSFSWHTKGCSKRPLSIVSKDPLAASRPQPDCLRIVSGSLAVIQGARYNSLFLAYVHIAFFFWSFLSRKTKPALPTCPIHPLFCRRKRLPCNILPSGLSRRLLKRTLALEKSKRKTLMSMSESHRFPCSEDCFCAKIHPGVEVTTIFASVTYKLFREHRTKRFSINVPWDMSMGARITTMSCIARKLLIPPAAKSGTLIFRLDWSHKPLTFLQEIQDWFYRQVQCGKQHTGRHWIPVNFPPPPTPPPPPLNRRTVRASANS